MKNIIYGYAYIGGTFLETGLTEKGAKVAATRSGYGSVIVGYRSPINNMFIKTAINAGKGWVAL